MRSNKIISSIWFKIFVALVFVIAVISGIFLLRNSNKKTSINSASDGCGDVNTSDYLGLSKVELAKTDSQKEQGLMNRPKVCTNQGMLFVYDKDEYQDFWMKDTPVSLDIIFIKSDGTIDTIYQNTTPLNLFPTYPSNSPCQYVLEVKAGFSSSNKLQAGDKVDVSKLLSVGVEYGSDS
jgi:uncharacterized membrane protein (UPF0127 family)